jgi:ATP-dependent protease HslVU (ClpYQ) peptidase subunit
MDPKAGVRADSMLQEISQMMYLCSKSQFFHWCIIAESDIINDEEAILVSGRGDAYAQMLLSCLPSPSGYLHIYS